MKTEQDWFIITCCTFPTEVYKQYIEKHLTLPIVLKSGTDIMANIASPHVRVRSKQYSNSLIPQSLLFQATRGENEVYPFFDRSDLYVNGVTAEGKIENLYPFDLTKPIDTGEEQWAAITDFLITVLREIDRLPTSPIAKQIIISTPRGVLTR